MPVTTASAAQGRQHPAFWDGRGVRSGMQFRGAFNASNKPSSGSFLGGGGSRLPIPRPQPLTGLKTASNLRRAAAGSAVIIDDFAQQIRIAVES